MCGINLIIDKRKSLNDAPIRRMSEKTQHRGPDETKVEVAYGTKNTYFLGSNRLKITDQSAAASQPFKDDESNCILLFNGEIYNYHQLKNQLLSKQVKFRSASDTEVLFHWIKIHGESGVDKLEGMFAFIFVDLNNDQVIISRDRFGIKSLYYFEDDQYFIASSEINAIIDSGLVKKELNESQIHHYLNFKYANCPETFFRNIYELEPGFSLTINNKYSENRTYLKSKNEESREAFSVTNVENLLINSLTSQLESKVPLGLLLSGGIDSTLLLALIRKEGYTIPTFSLINSKADQSFGTKDYHYSRLAASTFNSDHHELEADINQLDSFEDFVSSIDQPIGDSAYLMTSEICKLASSAQTSGQPGMRILLSGAGADEIFAGYNRHYAYYKYLNNQKFLGKIMPSISTFLKNLPTGFSHPFRKKFQLMKKWANAYHSNPENTFLNFLSFNNGEWKSNSPENENEELFSWALNHDLKNYLVNDVLSLSDKASMRHGIELRVPYLDEKLVDYLNTFPSTTRIQNGPKWILKEILKKHGGQKFVNRQKEGFGLPLSSWLFDRKVDHLWERIENKKSVLFDYVDAIELHKIIEMQKNKSGDFGPYLWTVLILEHWLHRHFG